MKAKWSLGPLLVICAALARQARRNLNRPPIRSQSPRLRHLQRHLSLRPGLWSTTTLEPKPAILIATSRIRTTRKYRPKLKTQDSFTRGILDEIPGRKQLLARTRQLDPSVPRVVAWQLPGGKYLLLKIQAGETHGHALCARWTGRT
jgi:hypothetical protein